MTDFGLGDDPTDDDKLQAADSPAWRTYTSRESDSTVWRTYTTRDGWQITERTDAPPRLGGWDRARASGLAGVQFPPYTPEEPDPRIVVRPADICPRCGVRPLLPVVRELTGGTCGTCAGWNRGIG